jgi:hypothetical protein
MLPLSLPPSCTVVLFYPCCPLNHFTENHLQIDGSCLWDFLPVPHLSDLVRVPPSPTFSNPRPAPRVPHSARPHRTTTPLTTQPSFTRCHWIHPVVMMTLKSPWPSPIWGLRSVEEVVLWAPAEVLTRRADRRLAVLFVRDSLHTITYQDQVSLSTLSLKLSQLMLTECPSSIWVQWLHRKQPYSKLYFNVRTTLLNACGSMRNLPFVLLLYWIFWQVN